VRSPRVILNGLTPYRDRSTTFSGFLANLWQAATGGESREPFVLVGATGFEPVTPSVSGKCSPAELRARVIPIICERVEAVPGIEPGYRVLQTLA
jgi:hypothetical protein